jgi:tetratricopeptide (TPR) repeat protein
MKKNLAFITIVVFWFALCSVPMSSQTVTVQLDGTVTDGAKPFPNASITLTSLGNGRTFKVKADKNGKFTMVGFPYGDYQIEVADPSGESVYKQKKTLAPAPGQTSANLVLDIDISQTKSGSNESQTGQAGAAGTSGQQQKYTKEQIDEIKKQNEKAQNFNVLIQQVNTAIQNKNWQDAVSPLQQLILLDPTNWQYYSGLGDAQSNLEQYDQAVETYQKGIQAAQSNTTVDPKNPSTDPARKKAGIGHMLTSEGNDYLKLHKNKEAVDAYTQAASLDPNPGVAYFNLCATQYNSGNTEGALAACDKAIAADPNKADAYFIKGSLLIGTSTMDKDGKMQAPPGTAEALNKYLQLAPDGPHAKDVKDMLAAIGAKVETTYKQKGK